MYRPAGMTMLKRSPKTNRRSKALPALGFAGVSLSMASGACASTSEASANTPPPSQNHEIFLGEEEISDVSLAICGVMLSGGAERYLCSVRRLLL
jgi:hypothetical protein